jgi:hypothetical protein
LLIARGDNAGCPDPPWTPSQVEGILEAARSPQNRPVDGPSPDGRASAGSGRVAQSDRPRLPSAPSAAPGSRLEERSRGVGGGSRFGFVAGIAGALGPRLRRQASAGSSSRWATSGGVFDQETEDYHVLNEEALTIWTEARGGASEEAIVERLLSQYPDAGRERVTEDVAQTVEQLRKVGLLP